MEDLDAEIQKYIEKILAYLKPIITELNKQPKFLCIKIANCLDLMHALLWNPKLMKCKNQNDFQQIIRPNITTLIDTLGKKLEQKIKSLIQSDYVKKKGSNAVFKKELEEIRLLLLSCYEVIEKMLIEVNPFYKQDIDRDWGEFCDKLDEQIEIFGENQNNSNFQETHDLAYVIWMEIQTNYVSENDKTISSQDFQAVLAKMLDENVAPTDLFIRKCIAFKYLPAKINSSAQVKFFLNRVMADSELKEKLMDEGKIREPKQNLVITVKRLKSGETLLKGNQMFKINQHGLISSDQQNQQQQQDQQNVLIRKSLGEVVFGRKYQQQFKPNDVNFGENENKETQSEISRQQFKIICNWAGFYFISCLALTNDTRMLVQSNHFYKVQQGSQIIIKQELINIDVMEFKQQQEENEKVDKEITRQFQNEKTFSVDKTIRDEDRYESSLEEKTGQTTDKQQEEEKQENVPRKIGLDDDDTYKEQSWAAGASQIKNDNKGIDQKQFIQIKENQGQQGNQQQDQQAQNQNNNQFVDSPKDVYEKLKTKQLLKKNLEQNKHLKIRFRTKSTVQKPQNMSSKVIDTSPYIIKLTKEEQQEEEGAQADFYILSSDLTRRMIVIIFQYNEINKCWEIASLEDGPTTDIALSLKLNLFKDFQDASSKEIVDKKRYQYQLIKNDYIQAGEYKFQVTYEDIQKK